MFLLSLLNLTPPHSALATRRVQLWNQGKGMRANGCYNSIHNLLVRRSLVLPGTAPALPPFHCASSGLLFKMGGQAGLTSNFQHRQETFVVTKAERTVKMKCPQASSKRALFLSSSAAADAEAARRSDGRMQQHRFAKRLKTAQP